MHVNTEARHGIGRGLRMLVATALLPALVAAAAAQSPYAGQEQRPLKALSDEEIQALLDGRGLGLAKAAELNGYPGPMHVLESADTLQLTAAQRAAAQQIYDRMRAEARRLGALIVAQEEELDRGFARQTIDAPRLERAVRALAHLWGELRLVHLRAHVELKPILTPEQIAAYDVLRGYRAPGPTPPPHGHGRH
jgi:Spy/CpxP family protein refolding chaperone